MVSDAPLGVRLAFLGLDDPFGPCIHDALPVMTVEQLLAGAGDSDPDRTRLVWAALEVADILVQACPYCVLEQAAKEANGLPEGWFLDGFLEAGLGPPSLSHDQAGTLITCFWAVFRFAGAASPLGVALLGGFARWAEAVWEPTETPAEEPTP